MPRTRNLLVGMGVGTALAAAPLAPPGPAPLVSGSVHAAAMGVAGRSPVADVVAGGTGPAVVPASTGTADGRTMQLLTASPTGAGVVNRTYSSNWSGLIGSARAGAIQGAAGKWTVPAAKGHPVAPGYSSTWVGVGGVHDANLIQTGTDQNTASAGRYPYLAWIEILPAAQEVIGDPTTGRPAPVRPGDKIVASVALAGPDTWTIALKDKTQHWSFAQRFFYAGPGRSAEWIEEAPTVDGHQARIADFGKVHVTATSVYIDGHAGMGWYSTAMGAGSQVVLRQGGVVRAAPSVPLPRHGSKQGQRFTDTYK